MSRAGDDLRRLARKADTVGGPAAAAAMADEGAKEIRHQLSLRSHPPGTPTPSPAGQPPARISGRLGGSVITVRPVPAGAHRWSAAAGPTAVQARIQDRGGRAGRNHATTLPPRPYMRPASMVLRSTGRSSRAAAQAFRRAVFGGG
jgi:hypothetical protein